jgi:TolA-binding protein
MDKTTTDNVLNKEEFVLRFAPPPCASETVAQTPMGVALTPMSIASVRRDADGDDATGDIGATMQGKRLFGSGEDEDVAVPDTVAQLRAQVAELTESITALREQLELENQHRARSERNVQEMQHENAAAEQRAADLVKQVNALTHALDAAKLRIEDLNRDLQIADKLRVEEEQQAANIAKKHELRARAVNAELSSLRKAAASAEEDCIKSRALLDEVTGANERLVADNGSLRAEIDELSARCAALDASVKRLQEDNARIIEDHEMSLVRRSSSSGHVMRGGDSTPSAIATPVATPARLGLFQSPATPSDALIGTLRPALLDELVQSAKTAPDQTPAPAPAAELVAALRSLQSLYTRSLSHAEQLSTRIAVSSAQRDTEVLALREQHAVARSELERLRRRPAPPARIIVQQSAPSRAWNSAAALLVALALYFGMCVNAYAASTLPGFRDSWPS